MKNEEAKIQTECVTWIWNTYPETRGLFFAVQNNSENVVRGLQRQAMGVVSGVSDTILLWKGKTHLIEFKTQIGRQSRNQIAWEKKVSQYGFKYYVVRSVEQFKQLINGILCS